MPGSLIGERGGPAAVNRTRCRQGNSFGQFNLDLHKCPQPHKRNSPAKRTTSRENFDGGTAMVRRDHCPGSGELRRGHHSPKALGMSVRLSMSASGCFHLAASDLLTRLRDIGWLWNVCEPENSPSPRPAPRGEGESSPGYWPIGAIDFPPRQGVGAWLQRLIKAPVCRRREPAGPRAGLWLRAIESGFPTE